MKHKLLAALFWLSLGSVMAAVPNNTLLIMSGADIPTMDPAMVYDTASGEVTENVYETLVGYKGRSVRDLEPLLATAWAASNGGRTYTFTLRQNVKFHSGNAMTCADAEYSIRRNLVTNNSDSGNWFISESLLGTTSNANDDNDITWAKIAGAVRCNGQGQLVLTMPKADPALLVKLAYTGQSVIDSKHAISLGDWNGTEATWKANVGKDNTDSELSKKPSGTGAYQLVRRDATSSVFRAFDGYWGGKPKIENVILQNVKEQATRLEALKKGDADMVETGPRPVLAQLQGLDNLKILDDLSNNAATAVFMNQNIKDEAVLGSGKLDGKGIPANFFADANVRKAFSYAFDYARYIREVQLGKGLQRTMLLPDSFFGYDASVKKYTFDPRLAETFFKRAFGGQLWANGFTLNASYRANSVAAQTAMELLKSSIEKINPKFKVNLTAKPWSDFLKSSQQGKEAMIIIGWVPDYADPDNFIHTFYHSEGYYSPRSGVKDSVLDTLINQSRNTTDRARRAALYSSIGKRAYDLAPFVLVPAAVPFLVFNKQLKGIEENQNLMFSGFAGTYWRNLSK